MTDTYLFAPPAPPAARIANEALLYPVSRIFCVGRNYAEHAREMGVAVDRDAPWYFTKPSNALAASESQVPYPPGTTDYQYEMELVIAISKPAFEASADAARACIFGFACGLDMTRRDLQMNLRKKSLPWDLGKAFEQSAILAPIVRTEHFWPTGDESIELTVNGKCKQKARLSYMVWDVIEIVSHLSRYYHLSQGDLIFTGTPAGVGPVVPSDLIVGTIDGLPPVSLQVVSNTDK